MAFGPLGFESNNFTGWSVVTGDPATSAAAKAFGVYGAQLGAGPTTNNVTKTGLNGDEKRYRFYFHPNAHTTGNGSHAIAGMDGNNSYGSKRGTLYFGKDATGWYFYVTSFNLTNTALHRVPDNNRWYKLEVHWKRADPDGLHQLWVDGETMGIKSGNNTGGTAPSTFRFGTVLGQGSFTTTHTVYYDDFELNDTGVEIGGPAAPSSGGGAVYTGSRTAGSSMLIVMRRRRRE